jgi:hypothetical protein
VIDLVLVGTNRNCHLERQTWDSIVENTDTGEPRFFGRAGANFWFAPTPTSATVKLFYYKELPFISTTNATNWFSTYAPELILSAAQVEAYIFLQDDARAGLINNKFESEKALLMAQANKDEYSSNSRIREEGIRLHGAP